MFFTYLGVILLSLLMTVFVCAAFLFFYRDGNIFGLQYIKRNEVIYANVQNVSTSSIKGISVASEGFDIKIDINSYSGEIRGAMVNKAFGYVHKSKAHANISARFDESTGMVVFNVVEPGGWVSKKDCYIAIGIPESLVDGDIDIDVNSEKGDISVGGNKKISVNDVYVRSGKGQTTLTNLVIKGDLGFDVGSGWLFVDEKCVASDIDISVKLGSGKINLTRIKEFSIKSVKVESIKSGTIGVLKAFEVVTEGDINGGGKIEVGEVKEVTILSLDTDIKVGTLGELGSESALTSRIDISGNGDVEILKAYTNLQITGHNGDVKINEVTGDVSLTTNQGDVEIYNAYKNVSVDTQYGNARVQFSDQAPQYSSGGRILIAGTKNGHIMASGLQNASVAIREKGRVSLDYDLVRGENNIMAPKTGIINIVVPYKHDFESVAINLKTISETLPDVKVGTADSQQAYIEDGVYILDVDDIYGTAGKNSLNIETATAVIKIRSKDLINF